MRPLHSLLVLILLAALGLGGFLLLSGDTNTGAIAAPLPESEIERDKPNRPDADLTKPDEVDAPAEVGRTELVNEPEVATPDPDAATRTLTGRFIDDLGNPLEGVDVYVASKQGIGPMGFDLATIENMPWIRREEARTDSKGRFEIPAPDGAIVQVAAREPGQAPFDKDFNVKQDESDDLGDLVMERSVLLTGLVVDSRGRGVEGAELKSLPLDDDAFIFMSADSGRGRLLATTDASGAFRIDQLASGPYKILIRSEDHPDSIEEGTLDAPGDQKHDLIWKLEAGITITGRVAGAPADRLTTTWIRALPIHRESTDSSFEFVSGSSGQRTCEVQVDGTFSIEGLREGIDYRVSAREGDRRFWAPVRSESVTVAAGSRDVVLQWRVESALVFRVVDEKTSAPIENFRVSAGVDWPEPLRDEDNSVIENHPEGRVRFTGIQAKKDGSKASLQIEATGYEFFEKKGIEIRAGEELELGTIRLKKVPLLLVRVVDDATGKPVRGARVTLREKRDSHGMDFGDFDFEGIGHIGSSHGSSQTERTDKKGLAKLSSLPDKTCEVTVKRKGFANAKQTDVRFIEGEDTELEIRLKTGGTVVVQVVDQTGAPVPGVSIEHRKPGDDTGMNSFVFMAGASGRETDSDGKKKFENLAAGIHRFRVGKGGPGGIVLSDTDSAVVSISMDGGPGGDGSEESEWESVEVGEGTTSEVKLLAPAKATLTGKVFEGGKPLAGAKVFLEEQQEDDLGLRSFGFGPQLSARTDGKGEFELEGAETGEYVLVVTHPSRMMRTEFGAELMEGPNEMGTLELTLCIVEGRVTNQDGDPLEGIRIEPRRATGQVTSNNQVMVTSTVMLAGDSGGEQIAFGGGPPAGNFVYTDADGNYRLRGVEADREIIISANGEDLQPAQSEEIRLNPDEVRTGMDFTMRQGGKLEVIGIKADGSDVGYCLVEAEHIEGEEPLASQRNDVLDGGRCLLSGLPPGKWSVSLRPIDFSPDNPTVPEPTEARVVEVVAGETAEITIPLP